MGGVVLGMPGPWADDYAEPSDHYTTKIGGLPDWPVPAETLRPNFLDCGVCANKLGLLAQVYAPIKTETLKIEERVIYVFGCISKQCGISPSRSWQAIRMQKSDGGQDQEVNTTCQNAVSSSESSLPKSFKEEMSNCSDLDVPLANGSSCSDREKNWWEDSDDEDLDLNDLKRALSEAATLASHSKKCNAPDPSKSIGKCISSTPTMPVVPCFYIYSQEEKNNSKDVASVCSSLLSPSIKEDQSHADDPVDEKAWKEEYEYDKALGADRMYLKFKKRLDRNPEQCIRYSYGGEPLMATAKLGDTGTCMLCGEPRHFELQLMSPLLYFLHEVANDREKDALENWDWMTLLVYTCCKSCSQLCTEEYRSGDWIIVEEAVIVQSEESSGEAAQRHYFS